MTDAEAHRLVTETTTNYRGVVARYPHPLDNGLTIKLSIERGYRFNSGHAIAVEVYSGDESIAGNHYAYTSRVQQGGNLHSRLKTAYRRGVEVGTVMAYRLAVQRLLENADLEDVPRLEELRNLPGRSPNLNHWGVERCQRFIREAMQVQREGR